MIPSYRPVRRLAVGLLAVAALAACGGSDDQSVAPETVAAADSTTSTLDTTVDTSDATTTSMASTDSVDTTAASVAPTSTVAGTVSAQGGTATTVAKAGTSTTVKSGAPTTTAKAVVPVTTAKPVVTTPVTPAPTTAPPAPTPKTVSATCTGGSGKTVKANVGDFINLTVNSENGFEQEFHVHGYDITLGGLGVTFRFTADTAGSFLVESHDTGLPACTLVVS